MKKLFFTLIFIFTSFAASAGLILDTNNDSFIDSSTTLEWIDFGVNNGQSFSYISSQLSSGGDYEGWRLPTVDEVYVMWTNVANLDGFEADIETPDRYGNGQFFARDKNNDGNTESVFDSVFKLIGYNKVNPYGSGEAFKTYGFFEGADGLSYVEYRNYTLHTGVSDDILLRDNGNFDSVRNLGYDSYSTLLVKDSLQNSVKVPEPSTLAIFALGLLALASRKNKKINL